MVKAHYSELLELIVASKAIVPMQYTTYLSVDETKKDIHACIIVVECELFRRRSSRVRRSENEGHGQER
jgi:hypothetical protein